MIPKYYQLQVELVAVTHALSLITRPKYAAYSYNRCHGTTTNLKYDDHLS
jgi:hypothetical protein